MQKFPASAADAGFVARWMHAFLIAWPLACASLLVLRPHVQRPAARMIAS